MLAETSVSAKAGMTDLIVVRVLIAPDDATETNLVEPLLVPMFLNITVPDTVMGLRQTERPQTPNHLDQSALKHQPRVQFSKL